MEDNKMCVKEMSREEILEAYNAAIADLNKIKSENKCMLTIINGIDEERENARMEHKERKKRRSKAAAISACKSAAVVLISYLSYTLGYPVYLTCSLFFICWLCFLLGQLL